MAATAAILKFFKPMSDWAETWLDASERRRDSELLDSFRSYVQDGRMSAILKIFKRHLVKSQIESKLVGGALERHRDSELLKSFCSDIQDGYHSGHLEILQIKSPPKS